MNIAQWTKERNERRKMEGIVIAAAGSIAIATYFAVMLFGTQTNVAMTTLSPPSVLLTGFSYSDVPNTRVTDKELVVALDKAIEKWDRAIGYRLPTPGLITDELGECSSDLSGGILACANVRHYEISVRALYYGDPETVFMHEIGHLLGVPHIEGDRLMSAVYQGKVDQPSPMAVAIAKYMRPYKLDVTPAER